MTVEWSRPPNLSPIIGKEFSVYFRQRYIATCRGMAIFFVLRFAFRSPSCIGTVRDDVQRETQERQAAEQRTFRQIEEVAIGGLHLEIVGLVWLFFGVLGTSIPDEIARWLCLIAQAWVRIV
jgi:hypothetical protein